MQVIIHTPMLEQQWLNNSNHNSSRHSQLSSRSSPLQHSNSHNNQLKMRSQSAVLFTHMHQDIMAQSMTFTLQTTTSIKWTIPTVNMDGTTKSTDGNGEKVTPMEIMVETSKSTTECTVGIMVHTNGIQNTVIMDLITRRQALSTTETSLTAGATMVITTDGVMTDTTAWTTVLIMNMRMDINIMYMYIGNVWDIISRFGSRHFVVSKLVCR